MQTKYPSFIINNETFFILPGHLFKMEELKSRLHLMGIDLNNVQGKKSLIDLYNSSIIKGQNKIKILSQLRKDTDNINNSKISRSQRQSLPHNIVSMNPSQNKMINISCDVKPYNSKEQQINIINPMHTNKGQYLENPFISTNSNQIHNSGNTINYEYSEDFPSISLNKANIYESNINNLTHNYDNAYDFLSSINKNNNKQSIVSNNSEIFNSIINKEINRESINTTKNIIPTKYYKEDMNNIINNNSNRINKSYVDNINKIIDTKKFEEDKNNNLDNKNIDDYKRVTNRENNYGNNPNINGDNNFRENINNNDNNYRESNDVSNNEINNFGASAYITKDDNNVCGRKKLIYNNYMSGNNNSLINDINNNEKKYTYQENNNLNNSNFDINSNDTRKTFNNIKNQSLNKYIQNNQSIYDINNNLDNLIKNTPGNSNSNISSSNNNFNCSNDNSQKILVKSQIQPSLSDKQNSLEEREPDEASNFSFFSNFQNFKKYSFYKNKKFILFHTLALILLICFTIEILGLISYSWDSITNLFSDFLELLTNPVRLIEAIFSFFSSIIFGAKNYYYITIPLIILAFLGFLYFESYFFKKRIKNIFQQILQDLMNNNPDLEGGNAISEVNIYEKYVKKYGVSYNEFDKKYLCALEKLRLKQNGKIIKLNDAEKNITFWKLNQNYI